MSRRKTKPGCASGNVRRAVEARLGPKSPLGTASEYIHHLATYLNKHPDFAVVLYLRVSGRSQNCRKNLDTYERILRKVCELLDIQIAAVYREVVSGWVLNEDRSSLIDAVESAQKHEAETGVHTVVLAPCTDRFIRNQVYNCKTAPDLTPTDFEFRQLKKLTSGVPLVTYLDPDMPLREVTSHRTRWGQEFKGRKGGGDRKPGWRNRRKEKLQPLAHALYSKLQSYRQVAERLGVCQRTAWNWVNTSD